ncbi:MAG: 16S rRNA (adenine(1518)-N(6)/adenine(1519)-N(6))-dimethyltransferase RsmA [Holophagaceae bacterium]|nr:16S rRNA (adenine(1518)-N(6)/adenine(1519)-N(6))-dimethyltransferase RsmA [Holophagaceae bacterium]
MQSLKPKKSLGQHFLVNQGAVKAICEVALASPAETILEIGPGQGVLTDILLRDGRPLSAIELDHSACQLLNQRYSQTTNFCLIQGDALSVELPISKSICVVGNLPYNVATAILTRLLLEPIPWERMVLMFQLEVGEKLLGQANQKTYGPLSVLAKSVANIKTILKLTPGSFNPPPKVDSIVVLLEPLQDAPTWDERKALLALLHRSFAHRRKTITNNWLQIFSSQQINAICHATDISPSARAESISPKKWVEIARYSNMSHFQNPTDL